MVFKDTIADDVDVVAAAAVWGFQMPNNSQTRTGTGKFFTLFPSQLTTNRIDNHTYRLMPSPLLYVMTIHKGTYIRTSMNLSYCLL